MEFALLAPGAHRVVLPLPQEAHRLADRRGTPSGVGHSTHTASTAAGEVVQNADYYGLARGAAKGGAPASRVAMYKACSLGGCASSTVLKAIDDAVADGVDVVSISIGMSSAFQSDFITDPIVLGAFHAHQKGVLVVYSGGNDGPNPYTVVNSAPWILTVSASSIDRTFQSSIVLGNGTVVKVSHRPLPTAPSPCLNVRHRNINATRHANLASHQW
ncbi:hypothetical protein GUJ93_ZPchr0001g31970 [Zizania palustris]|uniref:Peptidase S8/S53 domain-containing protein n=1 Tax=Zizania palustris TaxID=103762 RepID=A0A8J5RWI2_ZIZPA|nr:hypothetical protein GUJ93_ZPchr0001g31970 [Zizania palustris]